MPRLVGTYRFAQPPDVVFAFVADVENNSRWHAHVGETRWIEPPPTALGRRGVQVSHLFGRRWAGSRHDPSARPPDGPFRAGGSAL